MVDFERACTLDEHDLDGNHEDISHLTEYEKYCWLMKTHIFAQKKDYWESRDQHFAMSNIGLKLLIALPALTMTITMFFNRDLELMGLPDPAYYGIFPVCTVMMLIGAILLRFVEPAGRFKFFKRHGVTHVRKFDKLGVMIPYNDLIKKVFKYATDDQVNKYRNYRKGYYLTGRNFPWPDEE